MKKFIAIFFILFLFTFTCFMSSAEAFCGFYVAKAEKNLYNKASQVIIARNSDRTILTLANDYQGDVKDFALVVPVPVVLNQEQVSIGEPKIIERLDAFSAPRLVEYFDDDPCGVNVRPENLLQRTRGGGMEDRERESSDSALGITIERQFTVGEYDIVILSAKESNGLATWLTQNGYKIPQGGGQLLQSYIREGMKFFVAKINLTEYINTGFQILRPLTIAYQSPKFRLPIRLGMLNAKNEQDLIVYLLSPQGQTELTNYRTVKVPSGIEIPEFVQQEFQDFYQAVFQTAYIREKKRVAFLEYAWDMSNCDPCSAQPLNNEELRQAGVFWLTSNQNPSVFITRLHLRYTRDNFPEDLQFQETANRQTFQGRYIIRHPYPLQAEISCQAARRYYQSLSKRQEKEAQNLAQLTQWKIEEIRRKINFIQVKANK